MAQHTFCLGANTPQLLHAAEFLQNAGWLQESTPHNDTTHLLLPIPSLNHQGYIHGSGADAKMLLRQFAETINVIGGNLDTLPLPTEQKIDLLKNNEYLAQNAAITAHCAIKVALRHMACTFQSLHVLIIGWGRIGKCLARLLRALDANVTVAVRKDSDKAMLHALGYPTCDISRLSNEASNYSLIFNTAPHPVLDVSSCRSSAVLVELASSPGITGVGVIDGRGLPGKEAPRTSGELIGKTVLRLTQGKEHLL